MKNFMIASTQKIVVWASVPIGADNEIVWSCCKNRVKLSVTIHPKVKKRLTAKKPADAQAA
jgi:hypothetical protein